MTPKNVQMPNPNPKYKPPGTPAGGRGGHMSKCRYCKLCEWANDGDKDFFGWCELRLDSYDIDEPRDCPDYIRASNADRIRAMSDEELADIFLRADFCKCCEHNKDGVCNYICAYPNIPLYDGCIQAALTWMKQPAEEEP